MLLGTQKIVDVHANEDFTTIVRLIENPNGSYTIQSHVNFESMNLCNGCKDETIDRYRAIVEKRGLQKARYIVNCRMIGQVVKSTGFVLNADAIQVRNDLQKTADENKLGIEFFVEYALEK